MLCMRDDDEKRLSLSDTPYDVASVDDIQNEDGGILKLPRVNALRRALAVLLVGIVAGCYLQAHAPMFSATSAFHPHCPSPPRKHADLYYGKTLAPANYTVVKGFFRQDEDDFDGEGYDLLKDGFGLLDKSAARWFKFAGEISNLNAKADEHTTYKVIYLARHGEGYHNVAEAQYGTPAWNCHWSMLTGDGNLTWGPDPILTPLGESQARAANAGWKQQIEDGVPLPQSLYSSPLRRAAATLDITFGDIVLSKGVRPVIKETLRESIGLHTCDQRSSKSLIAREFPNFDFEPSFTEHDPLWDAIYQETESQEAVRLRLALNEIFATDASTFIGITAHGGVIGAMFRAIGKKRFPLNTGGFVPFVLKATSHPSATFEPIVRGQSATAPACTPT